MKIFDLPKLMRRLGKPSWPEIIVITITLTLLAFAIAAAIKKAEPTPSKTEFNLAQ